MNFDRLIKNIISELSNTRKNEDGIVELEGFLNRELRGKKAEEKVSELQDIYDELVVREEQGLANSDIDKVRISGIKAELEQAIADFILRSHKTSQI